MGSDLADRVLLQDDCDTTDVVDRVAIVNALLESAERRIVLGEPSGVEAWLATLIATPSTDARFRARVATAVLQYEKLCARFDRALRAASEARLAWGLVGDAGQAATVRALAARVTVSAGRSEEALAEGLAALEDAIDSGSATALMDAQLVLGHIHFVIQRPDEALKYYEGARVAARALGDRITEGATLDAIACTHGSIATARDFAGSDDDRRQLLAKTLELSRQAGRIANDVGHRRNEAAAIANQAEAMVLLGQADDALTLMHRWPLDRSGDPPWVVAHHLDTEGVICLHLGRTADAIERFAEALDRADNATQRLTACEHLADAYERTGDTARALAYFKRFHGYHKQVASEAVQRSASFAAVRMDTVQAKAQAVEQRDLAEQLKRVNEQLLQQADDLIQLSFQDPLTGLSNRRTLDSLLNGDMTNAAVAMIDVDFFKRINDGWSHAVGDAVLRQLATLIRRRCRSTDTPARCGGEEFAIVFAQCDQRAVHDAADRMRQDIEAFDWSTVAAGLAVTVSIGIAAGVEASDGQGALALADGRLYEAKRSGRNRVVGAIG